MGAYSYCKKCGHGLNQSDVHQVVNDAHECPSCGEMNKPNRSRDDLLLEAFQLIEDLDSEIGDLKQRIREL
jgi:RNA processing factor Prp31